ncbi:hypothetical protein Ancab_008405 [Ancistrocladus abbreviatus]
MLVELDCDTRLKSRFDRACFVMRTPILETINIVIWVKIDQEVFPINVAEEFCKEGDWRSSTREATVKVLGSPSDPSTSIIVVPDSVGIALASEQQIGAASTSAVVAEASKFKSGGDNVANHSPIDSRPTDGMEAPPISPAGPVGSIGALTNMGLGLEINKKGGPDGPSARPKIELRSSTVQRDEAAEVSSIPRAPYLQMDNGRRKSKKKSLSDDILQLRLSKRVIGKGTVHRRVGRIQLGMEDTTDSGGQISSGESIRDSQFINRNKVAFATLLLPAEAGGISLAKPNCPEKCGKLTIPYPFGIGGDCSDESDSSFNLACNKTTGVTTMGRNLEVLNITLDGQIRILNYVAFDCYDQSGKRVANSTSWLSLVNFTISSSHNKLVAIGCDHYVILSGFRNETAYGMGCITYCFSVEDLVNDAYNGIGCCETSIPEGVSNITTEVFSYHNHTYVGNFNPCSSAAVVANDAFVFSAANMSTTAEEYSSGLRVPVVLNWTIGSKSCDAAKTDRTVLCNENSNCTDPPGEVGYRCQCWTGYEGNPYIPRGCQEIDYCSTPKLNDCKKPATCKNTNGGYRYKCKCPPGLRGAGTNSDPCLPTVWLTVIAAVAGLTMAVGGGFWVYLLYENKKQMNMRQQFFQQNGGLILNEELARLDASAHRFRVFSPEELEKEHLTDEAKASRLTWEKRLHIAIEVASVLSHLHTKASPPILHRACLSMKGEERPTMREVEHELEGIRSSGMPHPWSFYEPDALQNQEEHEHLLHIALEENGGYSTSDTTNMYQSLNIETLPLGVFIDFKQLSHRLKAADKPILMGLFTSILLQVAFATLLLPAEAGGISLAKPNCPEKCGKLTIPYPFGIGGDCSDESDSSFNLACNKTTGVTTMGRNLEVLNITLDGQIRILNYVAFDCYDQSGKRVANSTSWLSLVNFTISSSHNKLVAIGCDHYVILSGFRNETAYGMGWITYCFSVEDLVNNSAMALAAAKPPSLRANDAFVFSAANISTTAEEYTLSPRLPVVLNWTIGWENCHAAKTDQTLLCKENSSCTDPPGEVGYRCRCWTGYEGNPYIAPGCQDIDECSAPKLDDCKKPATCKNTNGSYKCKCPPGWRGTGTNRDPCVPKTTPVWLICIAATVGRR